jgi:hypothetical protein
VFDFMTLWVLTYNNGEWVSIEEFQALFAELDWEITRHEVVCDIGDEMRAEFDLMYQVDPTTNLPCDSPHVSANWLGWFTAMGAEEYLHFPHRSDEVRAYWLESTGWNKV